MEKIRLTFREYLYLLEYKKINNSMVPSQSKITIEIDEDFAIDLHDWVNDKLQTSGFDENYELNEEGRILNNLVDTLNI